MLDRLSCLLRYTQLFLCPKVQVTINTKVYTLTSNNLINNNQELIVRLLQLKILVFLSLWPHNSFAKSYHLIQYKSQLGISSWCLPVTNPQSYFQEPIRSIEKADSLRAFFISRATHRNKRLHRFVQGLHSRRFLNPVDRYLDAGAFWKLLKKHRLYTYVVDKNGLIFTSAHGMKRKLHSKHVVLAEAQNEIFAAGEFYVENNILIFDNNSGSYRPQPKMLLNLHKMLKRKLPSKWPIRLYPQHFPTLKDKALFTSNYSQLLAPDY